MSTKKTYDKIVDVTIRDGINNILKVLGLNGLAGVSVVAPNALSALQIIGRKNRQTRFELQKIMRELRRQGLIHVLTFEGRVTLSLTPAGVHRLQNVLINEVEIPRPKKWDKKWRLVAFDIPTRNSAQRIKFVNHLTRLGFRMVQKSVWVHPFPCSAQVEQIASHYNVWRYCSFLEVERFDDLTLRRLSKRFDNLLS